MSVCVQVIYIYICIYLFICRFILCIWMLDFGYCRFPFIPRKAEDAQVSDVYSFLGSKRLVDPVPQQHCHAVPCCAMLCHAMLSSIAIPCAADLGVEVLQGDHAVLCCIGSDSEADCKIFKMSQYLEKNLKRTKATTVPEV